MSTDFLVVGALDGTLYALDAQDGSLRWTRACGHPFGGPVLMRVGDTVVAAAFDGYVCALALDDGALRWEMTIPDVQTIDSVSGRRRVVTNGEVVIVEHSKNCTGHDPATGRILWYAGNSPDSRGWWLLGAGREFAYLLDMERRAPPPDATPGPLIAKPPTFLTTAIATWGGTLQWFLHDESPLEPAWDGASSLVEADGIVYSYGRGLHAIKAMPSHPVLWTWEYLPNNPMGGMLVVGREAVVVTGDTYLGAFRRDRGTPLWAEKAEKREGFLYQWFSGLLALGEAVYVGRVTHDEPMPRIQIESYAETTGALHWTWATDPTLLNLNDAWRFRGAGETLYVPSSDHIWGLRATDGQELWHRELSATPTAFLAIAGGDA